MAKKEQEHAQALEKAEELRQQDIQKLEKEKQLLSEEIAYLKHQISELE